MIDREPTAEEMQTFTKVTKKVLKKATKLQNFLREECEEGATVIINANKVEFLISGFSAERVEDYEEDMEDICPCDTCEGKELCEEEAFKEALKDAIKEYNGISVNPKLTLL